MRRFTGIAAVLAMLLAMLPVLACAATSSVTSLTRTERDCCRQMHGICGDMAKRGCCSAEVRTDLNQLPAHGIAAPVLSLIIVPAVSPLPVVKQTLTGYRWHLPQEHSPPGLLIVTSIVLQI